VAVTVGDGGGGAGFCAAAGWSVAANELNVAVKIKIEMINSSLHTFFSIIFSIKRWSANIFNILPIRPICYAILDKLQ
jgi:hypothetical protein